MALSAVEVSCSLLIHPDLCRRRVCSGFPNEADPLGRRNPEAILLHVEATREPHLQHKVQVLPVLCLSALPSLVSPHKIKKTAGQDEEPAGVGRPEEERNPGNLQEPSRDPGRPKQPSAQPDPSRQAQHSMHTQPEANLPGCSCQFLHLLMSRFLFIYLFYTRFPVVDPGHALFIPDVLAPPSMCWGKRHSYHIGILSYGALNTAAHRIFQ